MVRFVKTIIQGRLRREDRVSIQVKLHDESAFSVTAMDIQDHKTEL